MDVADQPEDTRTVTERIAKRQKVPAAFLSKVVAQLTQSGLLRTHRGAGGGVLLGRSAEEINLRQIVEAVQGPIVVNLCTGPYDGCAKAAACPAYEVFHEAQESLREVLEQATLTELVSSGSMSPSAQRR